MASHSAKQIKQEEQKMNNEEFKKRGLLLFYETREEAEKRENSYLERMENFKQEGGRK